MHKAIVEVVACAVEVEADSARFPKEWLFHYRCGLRRPEWWCVRCRAVFGAKGRDSTAHVWHSEAAGSLDDTHTCRPFGDRINQ